jgi:lipoprotein Spr
MVKQIIPAIAFIVLLGSCSGLKQLSFTNNKPVLSASATPAPIKFIDNIATEPVAIKPDESAITTVKEKEKEIAKEEPQQYNVFFENRATGKNASALQLKYSGLLNTEADQLQNEALLEGIDEWYGTRYHYGGTTKNGIDCSAFVGVIYASVFGVALPRTAKDQYRITRHISRTELQEGDLLFFNTRGGVSHVGIYLRNNKFVHASVSNGVTVSDMFEAYYLQRFIGAGRVENKQEPIVALY